MGCFRNFIDGVDLWKRMELHIRIRRQMQAVNCMCSQYYSCYILSCFNSLHFAEMLLASFMQFLEIVFIFFLTSFCSLSCLLRSDLVLRPPFFERLEQKYFILMFSITALNSSFLSSFILWEICWRPLTSSFLERYLSSNSNLNYFSNSYSSSSS